MREIFVRIFFHEFRHKSGLLVYVERKAFVSLPGFHQLEFQPSGSNCAFSSSSLACIRLFSDSICSGVIVVYSISKSSNISTSKISPSTMCSAIVLMSLLFLIDLRTSSSNFSPISMSSLFLNFSNFFTEGSSRNLFMFSISIIGSSSVLTKLFSIFQ